MDDVKPKRVKAEKKKHGTKKPGVKTEGKSIKKRRVVDENSSSSDPPESKNASTDYHFSGPKSFKNIFSSVQSTLRGQADTCNEDLMSLYKDDPIMQSLYKSSPKKSSAAVSPNKKIVGNSTLGDFPSTSKPSKPSKAVLGCKTSASSSGSSSGFSSALDAHVTAEQLAVADLDTDTELDMEEVPVFTGRRTRGKGKVVVKKNTRSKAKVKAIPEIEIPSDDDPEVLEAEFEQFMTAKKNPVREAPVRPAYTGFTMPVDASPFIYVPDSPLPDTSFDGCMRIRIKFREKLHQFDGNEGWDVELVRRKLSDLTGIPESELLIYSEDEVKMVDGKTLRDYNVGEGDCLEAHRHKIEVPTPVTAAEGGIVIKFQKSGLKRPIHLNVSKYKSFRDIRAILALELKANERTLELHFDGDRVNLSTTPEDLGMEDDDCIDIHVINP